jgi:hypothetical protein
MNEPENGGGRRMKPLAKPRYVSAVRRSLENKHRRRWNPASRAFVSMAALLFACLYIIVRVWFAMHAESAAGQPHPARSSVVNIQLVTPPAAAAKQPQNGGPTPAGVEEKGTQSHHSEHGL